jgi:hypothetical protein
MLKKLTLALSARLLLSAKATAEQTKQPPTAPPLNGFLPLFEFAPLGDAALARGI